MSLDCDFVWWMREPRGTVCGSEEGDSEERLSFDGFGFRFLLTGSLSFAASMAFLSFLTLAFAFITFCKSRFALIAAILAFWGQSLYISLKDWRTGTDGHTRFSVLLEVFSGTKFMALLAGM